MSGEERDPAYPLRPDSPMRLSTETPSRFVLIDVCGRSAGDIEGLIPATRATLAGQGVIGVFVTDALDFAVFRRAEVIFEALPPLAGSADLAPDLDWAARRAALRDLIRRKWDPNGEIDLSAAGPR